MSDTALEKVRSEALNLSEAERAELAVIETLSAKMRIFRAPEFLGTAFLLAVLAMLVNLLLGS